MSRFALAPERRHQTIRRNLSTVGLGLLLFVGSLVALRFRPDRSSLLLIFGAAGALLLVLGLRRLVVGIRPVTLGKSAVWFGTTGVPLERIEAIEVAGDRLVILREGGRRHEELLADPSRAASEIARSAGLRPPRKGGPQRWERRAAETTLAEENEA
ncbi:hypothetical protein [Vulgatibacter sp.]|uniref:hypothetical protein n=1 Tax=Vulgatibacter sp. TaxID=1971226 RepID=UPI003562B24B